MMVDVNQDDLDVYVDNQFDLWQCNVVEEWLGVYFVEVVCVMFDLYCRNQLCLVLVLLGECLCDLKVVCWLDRVIVLCGLWFGLFLVVIVVIVVVLWLVLGLVGLCEGVVLILLLVFVKSVFVVCDVSDLWLVMLFQFEVFDVDLVEICVLIGFVLLQILEGWVLCDVQVFFFLQGLGVEMVLDMFEYGCLLMFVVWVGGGESSGMVFVGDIGIVWFMQDGVVYVLGVWDDFVCLVDIVEWMFGLIFFN